MKNQDIRQKAKENNIKLWEIAEVLKLTDSNFSRKLRQELNNEQKANIINIITKLSQDNAKK